jgi:hypothetical protein
MDLLIVSTQIDFIAVKSGFCIECLQNKMNTKIIKTFPGISVKDFILLKNQGLQGFQIECICSSK